ncbi:MAG: hypothetical protein A4E52_02036 [Pelotomaculum sp. PtaB.Bin013]|uniref:DUF4179 domain-containing protein n=1 Tax=Pelotomaculum isophthalicicum JI TaxID=947010 RepID=A0A9X4GZ47_9FIRM|nr:DUF4179 domain-containing protein [Pelotomaculum isophthalicicum]MDF9408375.1 DUF4179 domain-containing protein [Pelotomaculum isophthalicicum JI]OPX82667.1 MAG: hypothetical protein A4E52_02036 [Pelotomaculum sp. PtaB.Bin013]
MKAYKDVFDNIVVPAEEVDMVIQKAINKGKRQLKMKRRIIISASVVLLCACILGSGFVSASMARVLVNIPFIGSVFAREKFAGSGLQNIDIDDIAKYDDMQITDQGITVAIREAYYDQSGFAIGYVVSGAELSDEKIFHASFYYNGRPISGGGGGSYDKISDELYVGLQQHHPHAGLSFPDSLELEVVLANDLNKIRESPYRFKIPVSRRSADEKTRELLVMKAVETGDRTILVKKILFAPAATVVEYEYTHPISDRKKDGGVDLYDVKLINGSGAELNPGSFGRDGSINGEKWVDNCRVDFPAINEPAGNMAFEVILPEDQRIRVNFEIE